MESFSQDTKYLQNQIKPENRKRNLLNQVTVRHYQAGEEGHINDMFNRIFQGNRTIEFWRWKFMVNPHNMTVERRIVIATHQGMVIGQYAGMGRGLLVDGSRKEMVQIVDNFIDPTFRIGPAVQKSMCSAFTVAAINDGIRFGFGCPNERAYKVGKRFLGYEDLFMPNQLFSRLSLRLAARKRLPAPLRSLSTLLGKISRQLYRAKHIFCAKRTGVELRIHRFTELDHSFRKLWDIAKQQWRVVAMRDPDYLTWRYLEEPGKEYRVFGARDRMGELAGFFVVCVRHRRGERVGYIVDFLYREPWILQPLLRYALAELASTGSDYALCLALPGTTWGEVIQNAGFENNTNFGQIKVVGIWGDEDPARYVVMNSRNWFITYGDFDLE